MKLPKRKETLQRYATRTGLPLDVVREYQAARNAQRRGARRLFNRLGLPVSYGILMPDIRSYTKGGDVDFFRAAALSGSSWLSDIGELYMTHAQGYLSNLYQLTQEHAPDPDTFDVIGDVLHRGDVAEMLRFIHTIGTDAIELLYVQDDDGDGVGLDFSQLRRAIYGWGSRG